jgi:hypothetical protein
MMIEFTKEQVVHEIETIGATTLVNISFEVTGVKFTWADPHRDQAAEETE